MADVPVVYILSSGRSGSTLTDLLLGSHPNIWTLGEAQLLPYELEEQRDPCGCGVPIGDCDFWNSILSEIPLGEGAHPIGHFRESHTKRNALRWRQLKGILCGGISAQQAREAREYGQFNAQYFSAVREQADRESEERVEWLVDASKDPYRLYWLLYSGQFDLRVVHLTKDPRAYVYSIARRQKSYSIPDVVHWSIRWVVDNFIQSMLVRWHLREGKAMHFRYEDVALSPSRILSECSKWLNLNEKNTEKEGVIRDYKNHAISGNEMRWKETNIRLDEKWKYNLSSKAKSIVWVISSFLAKKYGYER